MFVATHVGFPPWQKEVHDERAGALFVLSGLVSRRLLSFFLIRPQGCDGFWGYTSCITILGSKDGRPAKGACVKIFNQLTEVDAQ
jgi:hypothetical protein